MMAYFEASRRRGRRRNWSFFGALLLTTGCFSFADDDPCAAGCSSGTCGEEGVLRFVDASDDPVIDAASRVVRPVAAGARYSLRAAEVEDAELTLVPASASVQGDAFALERLGATIDLRASETPGTAGLEVEVEDGRADRITLESRAVAGGRIEEAAPQMLASLNATAFALMPGASLDYSVRWQDAEGEALGGYGRASWRVSEGFEIAGLGERSDAIRVTAPIDAPSGTAELAAGATTSRVLQVRTVDDAALVRFVTGDDMDVGDELRLRVGADLPLFADVRDSVGRVLVAPEAQGLSLILEEGAPRIVHLVERPLLDFAVLEGASIGEARGQLTYGGVTREVRVVVSE